MERPTDGGAAISTGEDEMPELLVNRLSSTFVEFDGPDGVDARGCPDFGGETADKVSEL